MRALSSQHFCAPRFRIDKIRRWATQFTIAFVVGIVVCLLTFYVAWRNLRGYTDLYREQARTYYSLVSIQAQINDYKKQHGFLPNSLRGFGNYLNEERDGHLLDGWNRPFEYSISGDGYLI